MRNVETQKALPRKTVSLFLAFLLCAQPLTAQAPAQNPVPSPAPAQASGAITAQQQAIRDQLQAQARKIGKAGFYIDRSSEMGLVATRDAYITDLQAFQARLDQTVADPKALQAVSDNLATQSGPVYDAYKQMMEQRGRVRGEDQSHYSSYLDVAALLDKGKTGVLRALRVTLRPRQMRDPA